MQRSPNRFTLMIAAAAFALYLSAQAVACDYCLLPALGKHRAGDFTVTLRTAKPAYHKGSDPLLLVTLTNHGSKPMYVDAFTPVWKQVSLHLAGPHGGLSQADRGAGSSRSRAVPPGASYTFASPAGLIGTPLSRFGLTVRASGTYRIDASYDKVDGETISFAIE